MNIALDWDGTYTRDPQMWDSFITLVKSSGHKIYLVTLRYDTTAESTAIRKALTGKVTEIFFTGRIAKQDFMFAQRISIDVWIDDMPFFINNNANSTYA